jgi:hypothetical protein
MHFRCYADGARKGLYIGVTDFEDVVFRRGAEACHLNFVFPAEVGEIAEAYLIVRYGVVELCCCDPIYAAHAGGGGRASQPNRGRSTNSQNDTKVRATEL